MTLEIIYNTFENSSIRFESVAEQRAYPMISLLASVLKCKMYYQKKFFLTNDTKHETYRTDFILEADDFKIVIEIDGRKYHEKNNPYEKRRDLELEKLGYGVIHIPAREIFRQWIDVYERILTAIEVRQNLVPIIQGDLN